MQQLVDLHTHSTASDGALTPAQLVAAGKEAGLLALALTDHDTVDGLDEALAAGRELGLTIVPGVEISVTGPGGLVLHMLGLFIDHRQGDLARTLLELQEARRKRNRLMLKRLNEMGIPLTLEEVAAFAGGEVVGRPHFAQALAARKVVGGVDEAFNRFLAQGKSAYVPKERLEAASSMELIRRAGGLAVLAHPGLVKAPAGRLEGLIRRLAGLGLDGVEAYYTEHAAPLQNRLLALAGELNLAVSGGSDFHGTVKEKIHLGVGKGGLRVPASVLEGLRRRLDGSRRHITP